MLQGGFLTCFASKEYMFIVNKINYTYFSLPQFRSSGVPLFWGVNLILSNC
ncbi:unknown protein [Microcystis aeruginosa NIES-843]|uniref:Uncharacterized protein n=1 Tax=Microcystis aeruginosa (strain NIES-843 / IAM M-2473) TaxID=449447 RepID=B0JKQ5_MICAN|nr:unknown protein [Microcystis aeruginosa NIES-843]